MASSGNSAFMKGQTHYDLLIVGGGIIGCWTAYKAGKRGLKALLIEIKTIGSGASGGLLGALMPHMPERWDGKKQFQFEALCDLPKEIKTLEIKTGMSCGYYQCGRLTPIMNATKREQMESYGVEVKKYWGEGYQWHISDHSPFPDWPAALMATHGLVYDTLSARINPRRLLKALCEAIKHDGNTDIIERVGLASFDARVGKARLTDGNEVRFSHIIICAGVETFNFVAPALGVAVKALGKPIKGQAAMLAADVDPTWPIVFDNGLYVITCGEKKVAVGSTSENEFSLASSTDKKLDDLVIQAKLLCPAIRNAEIIERWAGLRPRAIGRDPLIDMLPNARNVIVSTSGFKITYGVAHKMADAALEYVLAENKTVVPDSFKITNHLAKVKRTKKQDSRS